MDMINVNSCGPVYQQGLTLILAWVSNQMPSKVWDEITYTFPNFNGSAVEMWEWISNFIRNIIMVVSDFPCLD